MLKWHTAHGTRHTAHAVMFHHFHDFHKHITEQGTISSEELFSLLDYYGKIYHIISADEFLAKALQNSLDDRDVCLSFDDGLLCQYDIAFPVLEQKKLKAFWFIYTSPIDGVLEKLEIYRHFRFSCFNDIEEFYSEFFEAAEKINYSVKIELEKFYPDDYAKNCPFYTPSDKKFRYLRDRVLGPNQYNSVMDLMIIEHNYDVHENSKLLWINAIQLQNLYRHGHIIGLHSHTHPTLMISKNYSEQLGEYSKNKQILETITNSKIFSVSYPCNSYNHDTLRCMHKLGIKIGFRANMSSERLGDNILEIPREDHANIIRSMRSEVK